MPRRAAVDWSAVAAAAPLSVVLRRDLVALGVPESTIARRTAPGGPWVVVIMGVVALMRGVLTTSQRFRAALLFAGADSVLTGPTACRLYGLTNVPDDGRVHVLIPHDRRRASRDFVRIERTRHLPQPVSRGGFPVVPVARAVVDAARSMRRRDGVRALVAEADGWVDEVALAWEIQSFQFHLSPQDYESSLAHVARLLDEHVIVAETLPKDLKLRRTEAKAELWKRYQLAASRPRPPVIGR